MRTRPALSDLALYVESKYPRSSQKVPRSFIESIINEAEVCLRRDYGNLSGDYLRPLQRLWERAKNNRAVAGDVYVALNHLMNRVEGASVDGSSDRRIRQLQAQIHDLRSVVSSTATIDERIDQLQEQVELMKQSRASISTIVEKQEDMLQKFVDAQRRAFIIMPFDKEFDNVWHGAIKPACLDCHYAPLRVDEVNLSSLITEDIEKYCAMAHVVIVDLTGNNPNVMFELGWSLGKNKKPIVLCQGDPDNVAFDVRSIRHISYENSWLGIETLKTKLKEYVATTEKQAKPKSKRKGAKKKASDSQSDGKPGS